jgi:hypothetical protein
VQISLSVYSAGKTTNNETFGKGSALTREPRHATLFYHQDCQIVALRFVILYFLLDFLIFNSSFCPVVYQMIVQAYG